MLGLAGQKYLPTFSGGIKVYFLCLIYVQCFIAYLVFVCVSVFFLLYVCFFLYLCCLLLFLMGSMFYVKVIITLLTNFARCKVKFLLSLQTYF